VWFFDIVYIYAYRQAAPHTHTRRFCPTCAEMSILIAGLCYVGFINRTSVVAGVRRQGVAVRPN
jgi:hypothetical protein